MKKKKFLIAALAVSCSYWLGPGAYSMQPDVNQFSTATEAETSLFSFVYQMWNAPINTPNPIPPSMKWENEFSQFKKSHEEELKSDKPMMLFLGSSSIRLWSTLGEDISRDERFKNYRIVNRGFGGSMLKDSADYTEKILLGDQPRYIVIYAGDNDLASGASPLEVTASFSRLIENLKKLSPQSHIVYISIKPSPDRFALIGKVNDTNTLIKNKITQLSQASQKKVTVRYADIYTLMLKDGKPREELFLGDKLHMNHSGYDVWMSALRPFLNE